MVFPAPLAPRKPKHSPARTQGESYYESDEGEDPDGNREEDEAEVRVHKFGGTPSVEEEEGGEE